jgi:hypothetical protein
VRATFAALIIFVLLTVGVSIMFEVRWLGSGFVTGFG